MKELTKTVLIVHLSAIVGWILTEVMGLSAYIFGPSGEGKFVTKSVVNYFYFFLYYINPAIYLLTLVFFIAIAVYQTVILIKNIKSKK